MCAPSNDDISNDLDVPKHSVQGHDIFEVEYLKNSASYTQSYYCTLIGNYTLHIEWYQVWRP